MRILPSHIPDDTIAYQEALARYKLAEAERIRIQPLHNLTKGFFPKMEPGQVANSEPIRNFKSKMLEVKEYTKNVVVTVLIPAIQDKLTEEAAYNAAHPRKECTDND